jgi:hypothetical protein
VRSSSLTKFTAPTTTAPLSAMEDRKDAPPGKTISQGEQIEKALSARQPRVDRQPPLKFNHF